MLLLAMLPFLVGVAVSDSPVGALKSLVGIAMGSARINREAVVLIWSWVAVMGLAQAGLLVVPVRVAAGRPVSKRWVIWPIVASLAVIALMAAAMLPDVAMTLSNTPRDQLYHWTAAFGALPVVWVTLAVLLVICSGTREPGMFMTRVTRLVLAGSIVELVVAAAFHVLGRMRGQEGIGGYLGLVAGFSMMIAAFGPRLFFRLVRRRASLGPSVRVGKEETTTPNDKSSASPD